MAKDGFLTSEYEKIIPPEKFLAPPRTTTGLKPYTGVWGTNEVMHLLKRTLFGAKKADIDFFAAMTLGEAVTYLLTVTPVQSQPPPPIKSYANSVTVTDPDNTVAPGESWINTNTNDGGVNSRRIASFKNWWLGQIISQERNILEKMTLFWHNHFATETSTIGNAIWSYQNNVVLRKNALGNFRTFVKEITIDPGMLRYLNGYLNTGKAPDENYGREFQELFTVGKGANNATQGYAEADVKAAAKVLTGWQINSTTNTSYFTASRHDNSNKQFSSFYNNTIITGRSDANGGSKEIDDFITMVLSIDDVSRNICRKLYRWFIYYDIDDATEANVITPLAKIFKTNNYEIKTVLSVLFNSEHFFDALNQGCVIKSPVDFVAGLCREFDVQFPAKTDYAGNYNCYQSLNTICVSLQQNIGDTPNVAGWQAYYQEPQFHELWINSDTFPKRNQFTDQMLLTGYTRSGANVKIDIILFVKALSNPEDPNVVVAEAVRYLLRIPLLQTSMDQLKKDILLTGQIHDYYWTGAWTAYIANPADATNANIVKNRLRDLFQYLMKLAEYQLS